MKTNKTLPVSPNLRDLDAEKPIIMRMKFKRGGPLIYTAHLDMLRIFERALLRSKLNPGYSQGFNPRPLMVFALPIGVGVETTGDYLEISFFDNPNPKIVMEKLNDSLPDSIRIIKAYIVPDHSKSLMSMVRRADYLFILEDIGRFKEFLIQSKELIVDKKSKGRIRALDIRPLILNVDSPDQNSLKVQVLAGSRNNLRPDLILQALLGEDGFTKTHVLETKIIRTENYADQNNGKGICAIEDCS